MAEIPWGSNEKTPKFVTIGFLSSNPRPRPFFNGHKFFYLKIYHTVKKS
jgi:hypothetical protein